MTIDQLREFLVLSEIGNYQQAADALYISQATLSRHIISLENEIGAPLFDRMAHTNRLNSVGKEFLQYAQNIVDLADAGQKEILAKLHSEKGELFVAFSHNFSSYRILELILTFGKAFPDICINIVETGSSEVKQQVIEKKCSFGFCTELGSSSNDNFSRLTFCTDVLTACLPASHPLAKRSSITLDQLKNENFIMAPQRGTLYDSFILSCKRSGFEPNITYTVSSGSVYHLVGNGLGIAILLKTPAIQMHTQDTCLVDISPSTNVQFNMLFLPRHFSNKEICFLKFVRHYISEHQDDLLNFNK